MVEEWKNDVFYQVTKVSFPYKGTVKQRHKRNIIERIKKKTLYRQCFLQDACCGKRHAFDHMPTSMLFSSI